KHDSDENDSKNDSDKNGIDKHGTDTQWLNNFNSFVNNILQKLDKRNPQTGEDITFENGFTCMVIRFSCEDKPEFSHDKSLIKTLEYVLNTAILEQNGIWQWLSESTLIVAIWSSPEQAEDILGDLVKFINIALKIPCHSGAAVFPFMDFPPETIPCNAVKALDHSAFFAHGNLIFFDDVTQNIYGDRLYQLGRTEDAAKEYEKGLEIKSDNLNLLNSLGVCYSLMNHLVPARSQFKKAIELHIKADDNKFMLLYNIALICNLMDDLENGVNYIKQATAMNSSFFDAELTAGVLLLKAHSTDESRLHLENAVRLNPASAVAHRILGEVYLKMSLPAKAVHEYTQAIKLNPGDACAMSGLARAFEIQNKNLDIALNLALNSLLVATDNPYFRIRLARIYLKKGKYDLADIEFSRAKQKLKENAYCDSEVISYLEDLSILDMNMDNPELENLFKYNNVSQTEFKKRSA
ncbi:MAG: tetratricopeptide repeat protein, partial [Desulfamplus sp.]|nr:tetratricopeptide repeat protein [Desulfamplus sp.]